MLFATGGMLIFPATGRPADALRRARGALAAAVPATGMARRRRLLSQEASMKYFLLGAFSSALLLFGIALVYGYSGSLRYSEIAEATQIPERPGQPAARRLGADPVSACCSRSARCRSIRGRPTSTRAPRRRSPASWRRAPRWPRSARCCGSSTRCCRGSRGTSASLLWTVAILTMVVGTVAALVQTDMKRVLGYSSIAHAGFILHRHHRARTRRGIVAVLFYLLVYGAGDRRRVRHRLAGAGRASARGCRGPARSSARPRTCRSGPGSGRRTRCSPLTSRCSCSRSRASR